MLLLGIVVMVVVIAFIALPEDEQGVTADRREPDFSLTNAEAIDRLEELNRLRFMAYEKRDLTLLPEIYANASKLRTLATREIRGLIADRTISKTEFETERILVVANTPDEIRLRQTMIIYPKFLHEKTGANLNAGASAERRVLKVVLRREGSNWLLYDSVVLEATPLKGGRKS